MDPTGETLVASCFELINMRAKLIKTSYRLCRLHRSCAGLFLVCRKTSLQTMKAMPLLQTENRLCRR